MQLTFQPDGGSEILLGNGSTNLGVPSRTATRSVQKRTTIRGAVTNYVSRDNAVYSMTISVVQTHADVPAMWAWFFTHEQDVARTAGTLRVYDADTAVPGTDAPDRLDPNAIITSVAMTPLGISTTTKYKIEGGEFEDYVAPE